MTHATNIDGASKRPVCKKAETEEIVLLDSHIKHNRNK